jgi:peptidoglycan/xylan/chitin deacetylase (PgdA/CDA1 family)
MNIYKNMPPFNTLSAWGIRFSGIPYMVRKFIQKEKTTILMFHRPTADYFERAVAVLKTRYNIIPFSRYLEHLENQCSLPVNPVVITLDDGWGTNIDLLPVIRKHQIPVTIFLLAGIADTCFHPWFYFSSDRIQKEALKGMSDSMRLAELKHKGFEETKGFEERVILNGEEIREMHISGLVTFGSHTLFHPILPKCTDAKATREISLSKEKIEAFTGVPCEIFSFPNGEYSERDIRICKKAGYKAAVTLDVGFNDSKTDSFKLRRFSVPDTGSVSEFLVKASGLWAFVKILTGKQKLRRRHAGL